MVKTIKKDKIEMFINKFLVGSNLGKISPTSGLVAFFIVILMITYLISVMDISPIVWKINWWIHTLVILSFLVLIPRSKHLHLILGPINIFFRPFDQPEHCQGQPERTP